MESNSVIGNNAKPDNSTHRKLGERKKIIIVTYYWIPSGGAGVQRWVKFAKYLRSYGWEPIIYAPANPEYPSEDFSFVKDIAPDIQVIKQNIWEPYNIYRKLLGQKEQKINAGFITENKKSGWKETLSIWIRGNFLIPDPRRFWVKPSVKFLHNFIKENNVDAIITTGPPHSMHLIGLGLKKHFPTLPWIADFRDPWTKIFYFEDLMLTSFARKIHQNLERKILKSAKRVIVVSESMKHEMGDYTQTPPTVISNGFDDDDLLQYDSNQSDEKFSISYIGTLTQNQNPTILWQVLGELCQENQAMKKDLQIQLIGKIDFSAINDIKDNHLANNTIRLEYLPHNEAIQKQRKAQVLLLLLVKNRETAKGILTGKFFEYLAAERPILALGPTDGDVAKILGETNAGKMIEFDDKNQMRQVILEFYQLYKQQKLVLQTQSLHQYSRKSLTEKLAQLLNESLVTK